MRSVHIIEQMIYILYIYIHLYIILITSHVFTTGSTIIHQELLQNQRESPLSNLEFLQLLL